MTLVLTSFYLFPCAPAAEPAKGGDPVPEIIKGLECDLKALANQKIQVIFQSLKTCLSQYYTLEEMKTHMSAAVEQYYTSLFVDDKLGREAYLEKSLRRAPARRHEAEEAAALLQCKKSCRFPLLMHMCLLSLFDFPCVRSLVVFLCAHA